MKVKAFFLSVLMVFVMGTSADVLAAKDEDKEKGKKSSILTSDEGSEERKKAKEKFRDKKEKNRDDRRGEDSEDDASGDEKSRDDKSRDGKSEDDDSSDDRSRDEESRDEKSRDERSRDERSDDHSEYRDRADGDLPPGQAKQREKKAEQERKELGKGSEQGQAAREENSRKWWKFWEE